MTQYHFHLVGEITAHDVPGHTCANDHEAREHADFIVHGIGTERLEMVRDGDGIVVRNEDDEEIYRAPLASTMV